MSSADPGDPLGYDAFVDTDMTPTGASCSGTVLVQNAMGHRLQADVLPMIGAPGGFVAYGVNVRRWVGEVTTQALANAKAPLITMALARDPRLDPGRISVALTVMPVGALYNLQLAVEAYTTTALPITAVYGITAATVELLAEGT